MPVTPVLSELISDPEVAEALRVHAAERTRLLDHLSTLFREDQRVRAAWLWGSFSRGEQDDLSDLDPWLLVSDEHVGGMGKSLVAMCEAAGSVVSYGENPNNGPKGGGYLGVLLAGSHGLHHVDLYWQSVSSGEVPGWAVLFDRSSDSAPSLEPAGTSTEVAETPLEENRGRIAFIWLMLSVVAKYLARDPDSDMALLSYPRNAFEETVEQLGLQGEIGDVGWSVPLGPLAKVDTLRRIAEKTALLEEACRMRGLPISAEANPCLMRYFELVAGIIEARPWGGGV